MIGSRFFAACVLAGGGVIASAAAAAQTGNPAAALQTLLNNVEKVQIADKTRLAAWEASYNAASAAQQAQMMRTAQQTRDALAAKSDKLKSVASANQITLNNLSDALTKKTSSLGLTDVFGLARQVAGQVAIVLQQSLITSQFPTAPGQLRRDQVLQQLASSNRVPTAAQLEQLWFEMQREMIATGQVLRYRAPVVQLSGQEKDMEVVRIGPFTATSHGQFLSYNPNLTMLSEMRRQPPSNFVSTASNFDRATSGYVPAVVDASRGVLLGIYVERPTWLERVKLGGDVGYVIITVGVIGAILFLLQLARLLITRYRVVRQKKDLDHPVADNPLGRVLLAFKGDPSNIENNADVAELRINEAVMREVPKLERSQSYLRLAVAAGPLLGLIGTVTGMILTFQSITEAGTSDPKLMATGIGRAMIATVLGLGIAIPLLFANALLAALSRSVVQTLDEQSAGILAESIERHRHD